MEYEQYQRLTAQVKALAEIADAKEFFEQTRKLMDASLQWRAVEEYASDACGHFCALVPRHPSSVLKQFGKKRMGEFEDAYAFVERMRDRRDYSGMLDTVMLLTVMELAFVYGMRNRWRRWLWLWRRPKGERLLRDAFKSFEYPEQMMAFICLLHLTSGRLAERLDVLSDYFRNRCLALALALREVILSPGGEGEGGDYEHE